MSSDYSNTKAVSVFYSYSHKDEKFREQLSNSLALLKRQGLVKEWYDGNIVPGKNGSKRSTENLSPRS
jgi:replicative DNA helicase